MGAKLPRTAIHLDPRHRERRDGKPPCRLKVGLDGDGKVSRQRRGGLIEREAVRLAQQHAQCVPILNEVKAFIVSESGLVQAVDQRSVGRRTVIGSAEQWLLLCLQVQVNRLPAPFN
jgi:hypothetical protein